MTHDPRDEIVDHLPSLRAFAMSLTRNSATADDIVQDTIVKAWSNIEKFEPGTNMRAWALHDPAQTPTTRCNRKRARRGGR